MTITKIRGIAGSGKTRMMAEKFVSYHRERKIEFKDMLVLSFSTHAMSWFKKVCMEIDRDYGKGRHFSFATANIWTIHKYVWRFILTPEQKEKMKFYGVEKFAPSEGVGGGWTKRTKAAISRLRMAHDFEKSLYDLEEEHNATGFREEYESYMKQMAGKIDYDELLYLALYAKPSGRRWRLVIIDEMQDLSLVQWNIIEKHVIPYSEEVILAGDFSQSIFRWRNAYPGYAKYIAHDEEIELTRSWRVPAKFLPIIRALENQIENEDFPKSNLESEKPGGVFRYMGWFDCVSWLNQCSTNMVEVLVLATTNKTFGKITDDFVAEGILFAQAVDHPFIPWASIVTMSDYNAMRFLNLVRTAQEIDDPEVWKAELWKDEVKKALVCSPTWTEKWNELDFHYDTICLGDLLDSLGVPRDMPFHELFLSFFGEPGHSKTSRLWNVRDQLGNREVGVSTVRMMEYFNRSFEGSIKDPPIKLSTIHSAKGLEADNVVIILTRDKWSTDDHVQLLINAVCRAKEQVICTVLPDDEKSVEKYNPLSELTMSHELQLEEQVKLRLVV